jgi:hypothetical protein
MNLGKRIKNLWNLSEFEPSNKDNIGVEGASARMLIKIPEEFKPAVFITKKPKDIIDELNP